MINIILTENKYSLPNQIVIKILLNKSIPNDENNVIKKVIN